MSKQTTVFVRNHKKRVYNGIWYMQIAEIPKKYLTQYLLAWFLEFNPESWASKGIPENESIPSTPEVHDVEEAKAYLDTHNIKFAKNMKPENIIKRAVENWWKNESSSPKVDDTDLSALNNPDDEESELDALKD